MIPRTREALSELLARTFPHAEDIDPETLDAFVDGLMRARTRTQAEPQAGGATRAVDPDAPAILRVRATHARRTPVTSVFTGETYSVWVDLPRDEPTAIDTPLGAVLPEDHLLPTVAAVRERFGDRIGRPFERVDLLTPARTSTRFAPMALYFGYLRERDERPAFVIYEPGDATGKPGALYLGETLDAVIDEQAGYQPTPLSSATHWYTGGVRMAANGRDPDVLYMHAATERDGEPHFRLHVEYTPVAELPFLLPANDLVEAALRMLAVQKSVGVEQSLIERLVAETGLLALPWTDRPDNAPAAGPHGAGPGAATGGDFVPCTAFDGVLAELREGERETFEASIAMLLGAVVKADGKFDRLERVELDWRMNFEVPSELGDAFRFSAAADREYRALLDGAPPADRRPFAARLDELGRVVARLPEPLRRRYRAFVIHACRAAAEASGGWLWFGTKVGAQERQVLEQITEALGLSAA